MFFFLVVLFKIDCMFLLHVVLASFYLDGDVSHMTYAIVCITSSCISWQRSLIWTQSCYRECSARLRVCVYIYSFCWIFHCTFFCICDKRMKLACLIACLLCCSLAAGIGCMWPKWLVKLYISLIPWNNCYWRCYCRNLWRPNIPNYTMNQSCICCFKEEVSSLYSNLDFSSFVFLFEYVWLSTVNQWCRKSKVQLFAFS